MSNRAWIAVWASCIFAAIAFIGFVNSFVSIDKGHVGLTSTFGQLGRETMEPGWHLVAPWKKVYRLSVQTTKNEEPANVPTKGGLPVAVKAILLYKLKPGSAVQVANEYGVDYEAKVVDPYFKNAVRDGCAEFTPEALYTHDRQAVETKVLEICRKELDPRGFDCEVVMLQEPVLPHVVQERITAKVGAEQDVQRMQFVLQQKKLEADAKIVEAEGIAKAQKIIQKDLSREYLVYQWIEALKSHSGSTIYIPTGADGLPFFKDVQP